MKKRLALLTACCAVSLLSVGAAQSNASLVWHYQFNNNLDDSQGANSAALTGAGTPTYETGPNGLPAVEFPFGTYGHASSLDLRANDAGGPSGPFSVAFWSKVSGTTPGYSTGYGNFNLVSNGVYSGASNGNFYGAEFKPELSLLYAGKGNQGMQLADGAFGTQSTGNGTVLPTNTWVHTTIVYDGAGTMTVYNGASGTDVTTYALTIDNTGGNYNTVIGPFNANSSQVPPDDWRLGMSDVRFYDNALTASDVQSLVQTPEPSMMAMGLLFAGGLVMRRRRRC